MLMKKEIIEDNKKLKEEIERLKRLYETDRVSASEIIVEQDKEIKRLNNVINKLEKKMKNELEWACSMNENGLFNGAIIMLEDYLDKLQKLKGVDKK